MNQPRIVEMYVNSYLDRVVEENGSTSTQFTVPLEEKSKQIQLMPNERSLKLKVFSAEIPNVLYNFKPAEDRLWFAYDSSIASIEIDTDRVYASPSALMDEINSLFPASAVDATTGATTTDLSGLSIAYDDTTKKCSLTNNTDLDVSMRLISSFRYANDETILTFEDMNDRLGFSQNLVNTIIPPSGGTLEGAGFIRMNRTNRYHITLEQQQGFFTQSITPLSTKNHKVVASLSVGAYGTLSTFNYVSAFGFEMPTSQPLTELTFSVRDDEMVPVDFVNHPITMSLQFEMT